MKKIVLLLLTFSLVICLQAQPLNVMTFNIRLNTSADSLNAWPYRKDKAASQKPTLLAYRKPCTTR